MRSSKILAGVSAGVLLALSGGAQAAFDTATFNVTASVIANCAVDATDLAFGAFDGSADRDVTSTIDVNCSNGAPYTLTLDVGSAGGTYAGRTMAKVAGPPAAGTLTYNLYRNAARNEIWGDGSPSTFTVTGVGTGMANALQSTVYGRLPALLNANPVVGDYASTITVTVTY